VKCISRKPCNFFWEKQKSGLLRTGSMRWDKRTKHHQNCVRYQFVWGSTCKIMRALFRSYDVGCRILISFHVFEAWMWAKWSFHMFFFWWLQTLHLLGALLLYMTKRKICRIFCDNKSYSIAHRMSWRSLTTTLQNHDVHISHLSVMNKNAFIFRNAFLCVKYNRCRGNKSHFKNQNYNIANDLL
jgi:hypothetical protein